MLSFTNLSFVRCSRVKSRTPLIDGPFEFKDQQKVADIFARYPSDRRKSATLPLLHLAQDENGFLNRGCIEKISKLTGQTFARVHETASFYGMFRFKKPSKHRIERCKGVPCFLTRNEAMKRAIEKATNGTFKEGKSSDGEFDLVEVECAGACASAPVIVIDGVYYVNVKETDVEKLVDKIRRGEDVSEFQAMKAKPPKPVSLK